MAHLNVHFYWRITQPRAVRRAIHCPPIKNLMARSVSSQSSRKSSSKKKGKQPETKAPFSLMWYPTLSSVIRKTNVEIHGHITLSPFNPSESLSNNFWFVGIWCGHRFCNHRIHFRLFLLFSYLVSVPVVNTFLLQGASGAIKDPGIWGVKFILLLPVSYVGILVQ